MFQNYAYYITDSSGQPPLEGPFITYHEAYNQAVLRLKNHDWKDHVFINWYEGDTHIRRTIEVLVC